VIEVEGGVGFVLVAPILMRLLISEKEDEDNEGVDAEVVVSEEVEAGADEVEVDEESVEEAVGEATPSSLRSTPTPDANICLRDF